jgi:hypothetical protein
MIHSIGTGSRWGTFALVLALLAATQIQADEQKHDGQAAPLTKGQRVFTCGHSFHVWVPPILSDVAKSAGINDHQAVGLSSIGGSRVIQHWNVPEEKNQAKEALRGCKVDVLTLSPIYLPDEGIEKFTELALQHNPQIRVTVQEFWERWDIYEPTMKPPAKVDHNAITGEELRRRHAPYFKDMDEHIRNLNKRFGKQVLYVVPVGQAVIALREKIIAGQAPGLKTQEALFTDPLGHPTAPLQALAAYCHFAVIYRVNPVGLPLPAVLARDKNSGSAEKLNRLLQELAWDAVIQHPLSGVQAESSRPASGVVNDLKIFNGEKRLFASYGPSTTVGYPARLQRKFYRYTGKSGADCPLQIFNYSIGGAQWRMPGWINCKPSQNDPGKWEAFRSQRYISTVQKLIKDNVGTPVIVIAMNNTGYACIPNSRIMGPGDTEHINMAQNFLRTHIKAIFEDGAALYFLSPKKYWRDLDDPHEWNRNEERYALAKIARENIAGFVYVKGVWEDTAKYKEIALVADGHHPTQLGDEIIASKFFRAMLEHDGLPVPGWDQEEVDAVRKDLKSVPWKP